MDNGSDNRNDDGNGNGNDNPSLTRLVFVRLQLELWWSDHVDGLNNASLGENQVSLQSVSLATDSYVIRDG